MESVNVLDQLDSEINELISAVAKEQSVVSYQTALYESDVVERARDGLLTENGGLIPSAVGYLKKLGYEFITIKRSDVPGNALVFVKTLGVLICVYRDDETVELVSSATSPVDLTPEKLASEGFIKRLLTKLFG